ncbi:uncharacterized protein [Gorilla gorilla gorilla]|uniref:uncharacterized protein n=1 Tax=Gorilla gorilla gorilla TaxID=9595 RepID=UPI00300A0DD4
MLHLTFSRNSFFTKLEESWTMIQDGQEGIKQKFKNPKNSYEDCSTREQTQVTLILKVLENPKLKLPRLEGHLNAPDTLRERKPVVKSGVVDDRNRSHRSKPAGTQVCGQAPSHSSRAGSRGPRPSLGKSLPPGAALRRPRPADAATRATLRRALATWSPTPASAAHERPRPRPCPPQVPRPPPRFAASDLPGSWGKGGARLETPSRPGFRGSSARAMPALEGLAGGAGPRTTHLSWVRTKRPALSRLKPLGPPHTPQCPRSLLVLDGPPIGLLLVHLKGLWARAARSLKGAARSRVSLWTRRRLHGWGRWSLPGASLPTPERKAKDRL